jgi:hypothetical protein
MKWKKGNPNRVTGIHAPREHLETKLAAISLKILGSNEEKTRLPKVRVMAAWNVKCLSRVQKGRVPPLFYLFLSFFLLQYFELGLKVLRPGPVAGPVQGSGSGFWPGYWVWPGRPGQFFLKKLKQRHFSKKKTKVNGFVTGSCRVTGSTRRVCRVTPGFSFPYFFVNPAQFRPRVGRVPGRPARPGRISKLCLD